MTDDDLSYPERQFDEREERRRINEMEAALADAPVLLLKEWASAAVYVGKTGDEALEGKVIVRVQGRLNKTTTELDFEMLVEPELAETIIAGMTIALDRMRTMREGYHEPG